MTPTARFRLLFAISLLAGAMMFAWAMAANASSPSLAPSFQTMPTPEGWLMVPTLSPDASQADRGAEVYRLVCSACHGDRGQGLTDEWRQSWAPADRNCWQSKCHAANHPPDGFALPTQAPAITGPNTLARFPTAADLHAFVKASMPWQQPGSLTDEEYWQLTSYLVRANGLGELTLDADSAPAVKVAAPAASTATPDQPALAALAPVSARTLAAAIPITAGAAILAGAILIRRRRAGKRGRQNQAA